MRLAIGLSYENVRHNSGGPFGAAIFEKGKNGKLIAVGVNRVIPASNSILHAENMAIMLAQKAIGNYSLHVPENREFELFSSCEPCAMCLGAIGWSGLCKVYYAALREDAEKHGFDEGPVFPQTYQYLEKAGISFCKGLLRKFAVKSLELYLKTSGKIYNS